MSLRSALRIAVALVAVATFVPAQKASAWAPSGPCNSPIQGYFDGYQANNGYYGSTYRGVIGNIVIRAGDNCFGDYNRDTNFLAAWYMIAGPIVRDCGPTATGGYAQVGMFQGIDEPVKVYAETNPDGCGTIRRITPYNLALGSSHRYSVQWYWWAHLMAMQVDGQDVLYSDFDPQIWWGADRSAGGWVPEVYGEVKHLESNMPGQAGTSAFFSAMGSMADSTSLHWVGALGLNGNEDDNRARWAQGPLNEFNPNVYGLNFQIYSY